MKKELKIDSKDIPVQIIADVVNVYTTCCCVPPKCEPTPTPPYNPPGGSEM